MNTELKIKQAFQAFDLEHRKKHGLIVHDTEKGIWGPSNLDIVFDLFKKISLKKFKSFLDIGAGDGRVVCAASLFTTAAGIEADKELVTTGNSIIKKLKLNAQLICDDFYKHDFSQYDILFINPDTSFHRGLEQKLLSEMKKGAVLLVYNNIFMPQLLTRGKTHWIQQTPITEFTKTI